MASAIMNKHDPNSFSQTDVCIITKIDLDWKVNFEQKCIRGTAVLHYENKQDSNQELVLDTSELKIHRVYDKVTDKDLQYELAGPYLSYGSKLTIHLCEFGLHSHNVCIDYETTEAGKALQWLSPEQTAGKQQPYLFSQCQSIHARSLLPCQDTPKVKHPFTAKVEAPAQLEVLTSGIREDAVEASPGDGPTRVHRFHQDIPMPTNLISIVCGALVSRDISQRCRIWSEKELIDDSAREFEDTEKMLQIAEELVGIPYVWGRYDLLVLPPSFPFGGMENPCLTFLTPTLLAKDKSLVGIVAHEIAHSWTGNLVSVCNWEHFWLNEGFTVFLERKIQGRMFGEPYRHLAAINGWQTLRDEVERLGSDNPFTCLVVNLEGKDPDDAFSSIPYEKGSAFLMYLEQHLGGSDIFEPFFTEYLKKFQYKSVRTDEWLQFFFTYFSDKVDAALLQQVDWNGWMHKPGLPPNMPQYDRSLTNAGHVLCQSWVSAADNQLDQFSSTDVSTFHTLQWTGFLHEILEEKSFSIAKIRRMEDVYMLSEKENCDIRLVWTRICIKARYEGIIDSAIAFLNSQGRMKFIRPIYKDLFNWDKTREKAIKNFLAYRHQLHVIAASMVAKDLQLSS